MVISDLTGKNTALDIDKECHQLENTSKTLSLHKDPTRIMRGIVTVDAWDSFSSHNKDKAVEEVKFSVRLREAMNHTVLQVRWHDTNHWKSSHSLVEVAPMVYMEACKHHLRSCRTFGATDNAPQMHTKQAAALYMWHY